jgi:SAM-dependent methyltransferase
MMLFEWTDEKIEWYARASGATGYHRRLAELIAPCLLPRDDVIDIGCGLGLIDMEIASGVKSITAVDIDALPVAHMKRALALRGIGNVFPQVRDASEIGAGKWDVVLMCFFGTPGNIGATLNMLASSCRRIILIMHGEDAGFAGGKAGRVFCGDMERFLAGKGLVCDKRVLDIEFGQPLLSVDEARRFLACYGREPDGAAAQNRIEAQLEKLLRTGDAEYPYFLPRMKSTAILTVDTAHRASYAGRGGAGVQGMRDARKGKVIAVE